MRFILITDIYDREFIHNKDVVFHILKHGGVDMRIQSSYVEMQAQSYKNESLKISQSRVEEEPATLVDQSSKMLDLFDVDIIEKDPVVGGASKTSNKIYEMSEEDYQKVKLLEKILSALTGKNVKFTLPKRVEVKGTDGSVKEVNHNQEAGKPYMRRSIKYKRQQAMKFEAAGVVRTADGREISFNLKMARKESIEFASETVVDREGNKVDPLVINYEGTLPNLTGQKYDFDLDFDGTSDQISFLSKGSGFLAFDKNEDGTINDGRELFGPQNGDGFAELAKYDEDGNGWIDEGDSIFDKLRVWNKDEEGNDVLFALGEVGVGAIFLGNVATDYALGSSPLSDDGFIRSTGIFLKESGEVGSVQHIDLSL